VEAASAVPVPERRPTRFEAAAIGVAISTVLNAPGVFTEDAIHWLNLVIGFVIAAVAAAIVFGWFVRRACRPGARAWPTALVFAVLALITVPAFWSGLPPVFAVAAIYLGRRSASHAGLAAIVLGVLAVAGDVGAYATDIAGRV
jgi:small-conductance mechanosensitive channel